MSSTCHPLIYCTIEALSVRANPSPEQAQLCQAKRGPHRSLKGGESPTRHSLFFPDGPRSAISQGQGSADKGWLLLHVKKSILDKHSPREQGGAVD